jgi:hypothetical protein
MPVCLTGTPFFPIPSQVSPIQIILVKPHFYIILVSYLTSVLIQTGFPTKIYEGYLKYGMQKAVTYLFSQ